MSASVKSFKDLVEKAYAGRLKLPAFQRKWRWRPDKVMKLFDSLRQKYPIGSLLFLAGDGTTLSPRSFHASRPDADKSPTEYLVLDGQQRITAGVCLFYGTGTRQYFLDLKKLGQLAEDRGVNLKDAQQAKKFADSLDVEDAYLMSRPAKGDPRAFLVSHDLLCTAILADPTALNQAMLDYVKQKPAAQDLLFNLVQPYFNLSATDTVPYVTIESDTQIEAISRIFTTLNTTGQLLTPFELVVAILYPSKIDVRKDYDDLCNSGKFFPNMDKTGEILLQTIAMLGGVDPKKANLPKTITAALYSQHKDAAFTALEDLGAYLTYELGVALDSTNVDLIPYDAIYAPMACAFKVLKQGNLKGPAEANAKKKLNRWFVGSALSQRYQEGVHNKQKKDYTDFVTWLKDDANVPAWITETGTPVLARASIDGALGKLVQCLLNQRGPVDPVTGNKIGFRPGADATEKHHIFPSKYVPALTGWVAGKDSADNICNMMLLARDSNKRWINGNPSDHITEALKETSPGVLAERYALQFVTKDSYEILKNPAKTKADYEKFITLREAAIRQHVKEHFGFEPIELTAEEDVDEEDEK